MRRVRWVDGRVDKHERTFDVRMASKQTRSRHILYLFGSPRWIWHYASPTHQTRSELKHNWVGALIFSISSVFSSYMKEKFIKKWICTRFFLSRSAPQPNTGLGLALEKKGGPYIPHTVTLCSIRVPPALVGRPSKPSIGNFFLFLFRFSFFIIYLFFTFTFSFLIF